MAIFTYKRISHNGFFEQICSDGNRTISRIAMRTPFSDPIGTALRDQLCRCLSPGRSLELGRSTFTKYSNADALFGNNHTYPLQGDEVLPLHYYSVIYPFHEFFTYPIHRLMEFSFIKRVWIGEYALFNIFAEIQFSNDEVIHLCGLGAHHFESHMHLEHQLHWFCDSFSHD